MTELPEPLRDEIVRAVASLPEPERARSAGFARGFLADVEKRVLSGRGAAGLARIPLDMLDLAARRAPDQVLIRVRNPDDRAGRTVLELVQRDRPFLVDTLRLALRRHDLREQLLLHPILSVTRSPDGRLSALGDADGALRESMIYLEAAPRIETAAQIEELRASLDDVMAEVRDVTDDHQRMLRSLRELSANLEFAGARIDGGAERAAKICRFLDWLTRGNFVFMGFRRYDVSPDGALSVRRDSGLGLLRREAGSRLAEPQRGDEIPEVYRERLRDRRLVRIEKARREARVHRGAQLDRILVKQHDENGRVDGLAIVLGLFTFHALREPPSGIPILSERLAQILDEGSAEAGSHRYSSIAAAFDSMPVEFLLESETGAIGRAIEQIARAEGSDDPRLVLSEDRGGRSLYAAVVMPSHRYRADQREQIGDLLAERLDAVCLDARTSFLEQTTVILSFFCTARGQGFRAADPAALEDEVDLLCSDWHDRFVGALIAQRGEALGLAAAARFDEAFPEPYRAITDARDAARDVEAIEALERDGELRLALYFDARGTRDTNTLTLFMAEPRLLSDLLPIVDHHGIRVVDAQQSEIRPADHKLVAIETLRVLALGGEQADLDAIAPRLAAALRAAVSGTVPDDRLNALVLLAGLDWREIDVLRAYVEYFMQVQGALTRLFLREALLSNPLASRLLVQYFRARLAPDLEPGARTAREAELAGAFSAYRDRIVSLNEDRALFGLFRLIEATVRTNFFAPASRSHFLAFKLDSSQVPGLPAPVPFREIFVHGPGLFGVHLRGGAIARGGLRFSDRADDVRAEVLDLMETQMLKNGLIVPVGAKGGFVLRGPPLSTQEQRAVADRQYRVFVSGLLDLTDNLAPDGKVVPPSGLHRRDGDDAYLVVAADRGTAHLSDTANAVAAERDFWLGDAFASGGSEGYDHKKYAITARGAWECVRHHFAELGIDPDHDEYSVAGIGDMSGDVFGNGLLVARRARLVAAFDHRHLFLDPDPDPERARAERERLFALPGSSWADYATDAISAGGGVWPRSARVVPLSPQARALLGIEGERPTGQDVVRAILKLQVDLLFNGGIGTYVKASHETHAQVGDRANDAVRVDASELRARVIGEGGNLGLTQAARCEAAAAGVRVDMDSIHNSAGVDLSDHEVNLKILIAPAVRAGRLSQQDRHKALFEVAEEACERVLAHNRSQSLALSLDELRSSRELGGYALAISYLSEIQRVSREDSQLPGEQELAERQHELRGLLRPELSWLLGLAKLCIRQQLAKSPRIRDEWLTPLYHGYFPNALLDAFPEAVASHPLRSEITALQITNRIVDSGGVALIPLLTEPGISIPEAAFAVLHAEALLDAANLRQRVLELSEKLEHESIYKLLLALEDAVADVARFLIDGAWGRPDSGELERWRAGLLHLQAESPDFMSPPELKLVAERARGLRELGAPDALARELATLPLADRALNIIRVVERTRGELLDAAPAYTLLGEQSGLNWAFGRIRQVPAATPWERAQLRNLRAELLDLQFSVTAQILERKPESPVGAMQALLDERREALERPHALRKRSGTDTPSALAVVVYAIARALRRQPDEPCGDPAEPCA